MTTAYHTRAAWVRSLAIGAKVVRRQYSNPIGRINSINTIVRETPKRWVLDNGDQITKEKALGATWPHAGTLYWAWVPAVDEELKEQLQVELERLRNDRARGMVLNLSNKLTTENLVKTIHFMRGLR